MRFGDVQRSRSTVVEVKLTRRLRRIFRSPVGGMRPAGGSLRRHGAKDRVARVSALHAA